MTTRGAACHCGQLRLEVSANRLQSRSAIASPAGSQVSTRSRPSRIWSSIDMWEALHELAVEDADLDPIRDEPAFGQLISR